MNEKKIIEFTLRDPMNGKSAKGTIHLNGWDLGIKLEGFGTGDTEPGTGIPIWLELHEKQVQLIVFKEINEPDPEIVNLMGAMEARRKG